MPVPRLGPRTAGCVVTDDLQALIAAVRRQIWLDDPLPLLAVVATYVSVHAGGIPLWLAVVGPSGAGKTLVGSTLSGLPHVQTVDAATTAGLARYLTAPANGSVSA